MINKKKRGYVLLSVMSLSVLLLVMGSSALYMSQMGSQTLSSEMQYQKAKFASEYALNKAITAINTNTDNSTNCLNGSTGTLSDGKTNYGYVLAKAGGSGDGCFVYSVGTLNGTKVVKTVIVPYKVLPATGGALNAGSIVNTTFNGSNPAIGSACGPAVVYKTITADALSDITASAVGTPKTLQDTTTNVYSSNFGDTVTNWSQLKTKVKATVAAKAASLSTLSRAACTVTPSTALDIQNTSCTTTSAAVVCSGAITKTIPLATCPDIVILAGTININDDMPSTNTFTVNATNTMSVSSNVNGLITSDGDLNISQSGGQVNEGIFIGSGSSNLSIANGHPTFNGMLFLGNDTHTSTLSMTTNGNTKIAGSVVIDGTLNNLTRNGGGTQSPNIEYAPEMVNAWSTNYPGLVNNMTCNSGPPPKLTSISKTKMTMY